jgi:hypothetical protein
MGRSAMECRFELFTARHGSDEGFVEIEGEY